MGYVWPAASSELKPSKIPDTFFPGEKDLSISFSWAFPIVHDIIRPVYHYILRDESSLIEQLSRVHGAAIIALLSDSACDRHSIISYLYETYEHLGLDRKNCVTLHRLIVSELTAVISVRNRQSPRRRAELEAIIAMRLGLVDRGRQPHNAVRLQRAAA